MEEIKLTFEYAICGKLDVSATVYHNFNTEYLAKVLNAYKRFIEKNKTFTEYLDEQETLPKLIPSPKEQMQEIISSFLMNYQKVILEGYEIQSLYLQEIYF